MKIMSSNVMVAISVLLLLSGTRQCDAFAHKLQKDGRHQSITALAAAAAASSRRDVLAAAAAGLLTTTTAWTVPRVAASAEEEQGEEGELSVFKTSSGLKYIELETGTGPTPAYGQLCSIQYQAFVKLPASSKDPNPQPVPFDNSQSAYLTKHGNGRLIAGLDEGLHTMRVGGKRRLLIPPKLGYTQSGLGPIPSMPWDRWKLNSLLDQMVELRGGTVIVQVELLSCIDDEADQGYYTDDSLSPEEFEALKSKLQKKTTAADQQEI